MRLNPVFGITAVWMFVASFPPQALAADPVRGYELFQMDRQGPCSRCHGNPRDNRLKILNGANRPDIIAAAARKIGAPATPQRDFEDLAAYLGTYLAGAATVPPVAPSVAVEYYHAGFQHYFVTAIPQEIVVLDSGQLTGWTRTGLHFHAWLKQADAPPNATPVCRFYIPPAQGNSHFYSASPAECAIGRVQFPTFTYEAGDVMYVMLPDLATGGCPGVTAPVYRLWNDPAGHGRTDNNHRFTTDTTTRDQMLAAGYKAEGYGIGVGMCAPLPLLPF
jgi:hypothetical protein